MSGRACPTCGGRRVSKLGQRPCPDCNTADMVDEGECLVCGTDWPCQGHIAGQVAAARLDDALTKLRPFNRCPAKFSNDIADIVQRNTTHFVTLSRRHQIAQEVWDYVWNESLVRIPNPQQEVNP